MLNMLFVMFEQSLIYLPLVTGSYISFSLLKVPDLSLEAAYVVGAIFATTALSQMQHLPTLLLFTLAILTSLVGGACVGLISSLLTQKGKLPHLLSSIITCGLFHGLNQLMSPVYVSLSNFVNPLMLIYSSIRYPELPILLLVGLVTFCAVALLFKTQLGYTYAIYGNNPQFFNYYSVSTSYVFITGIIIANALAGLSGYLFAQSNNFFELNMGYAKALFCISALILGKSIASIKKPFSVMVPLLGTVSYFVLQQLLIKVGFDLKYFTAVQAVIVACILLYNYRKGSHTVSHDNLGI